MNDELRTHVRRFGFTEKEADTYIAVLEHGPATVTEVANEASISKRHVYNVAKNLEERHFVVVNDYFNPTTIEAAPPEEVYETVHEQVDEMYQRLDSKYQTRSGNADNIRVLKSRSTVINNIIDLIESAENLLAISLPAIVIPVVRESLSEAVDRGVVVLALIFEGPTSSVSISDVSTDGIAHVVRHREGERAILMAVDDDLALVSSRGVITQPNSPVDAIFSNQPYFQAVVFTSLINTEWVNAEELMVTRPRELPQTYTTFRRAAIDAALYLNDGERLEAEIEARPTDRSESVVGLVGEVDRVNQRLVEPTTDPPPGQCNIRLRRENDVVTVGGNDAVVEEYRAFKTTLAPVE